MKRTQGSHFFIPSNSLIFPDFLRFFLRLHEGILVKKKHLFFLNVALVKLVYANITSLGAISWQLLKKGFSLLKKHFSLFPWLEKVFKIFPDLWEPYNTLVVEGEISNKVGEDKGPLAK